MMHKYELVKNPNGLFFKNPETNKACGEEIKQTFGDRGGFWTCLCIEDKIYGEYIEYGKYNEIIYHSLHNDDSEVYSCVANRRKVGSKKELERIAEKMSLPLLRNIPNDDEGRLVWALKYPWLPLIPINVKEQFLKSIYEI